MAVIPRGMCKLLSLMWAGRIRAGMSGWNHEGPSRTSAPGLESKRDVCAVAGGQGTEGQRRMPGSSRCRGACRRRRGLPFKSRRRPRTAAATRTSPLTAAAPRSAAPAAAAAAAAAAPAAPAAAAARPPAAACSAGPGPAMVSWIISRLVV